MNRNRHPLLALTLGLALLQLISGCANLTENTLLAPTRARPELGLRLRVVEPVGLPANIVGDRPRVLLVIGIKPGRPAARAGIETGDLLLSLDGEPVSGMANSVAQMQNHDWGDRVMLTVVRGGQLEDIPVVLELQ